MLVTTSIIDLTNVQNEEISSETIIMIQEIVNAIMILQERSLIQK